MTKLIRGVFIGFALTLGGMTSALAGGHSGGGGGDQPASCHDNCTILVLSKDKYDSDSHPTSCHDNCTVKTTDPSTVTCHDNCKIVYAGGQGDSTASCHDKCKIVAVNSSKSKDDNQLNASCHDNCKIVNKVVTDQGKSGGHSSGHKGK